MQHKERARRLKVALDGQGVKIQLGHALEAVAAMHGLPNWDTLSARPETDMLPPDQARAAAARRLERLGTGVPPGALEGLQGALFAAPLAAFQAILRRRAVQGDLSMTVTDRFFQPGEPREDLTGQQWLDAAIKDMKTWREVAPQALQGAGVPLHAALTLASVGTDAPVLRDFARALARAWAVVYRQRAQPSPTVAHVLSRVAAEVTLTTHKLDDLERCAEAHEAAGEEDAAVAAGALLRSGDLASIEEEEWNQEALEALVEVTGELEEALADLAGPDAAFGLLWALWRLHELPGAVAAERRLLGRKVILDPS